MAPNLPPKSPRMAHTHHHLPLHNHNHNQIHPVIPITQPQSEIIIDTATHKEDGREVGGIEYHPLGKSVSKLPKNIERVRGNEGMGEGVGWNQCNSQEASRSGGRDGHEHGHKGHELSRQPHRDTQETGPSPLPAAITAQHLSHGQHGSQPQIQPHIQTQEPRGGPKLHIQPPTPDNPTPPPPLQIRSLNINTPSNPNTQVLNNNQHGQTNEGRQEGGRSHEGALNEGEGGVGGGGGGVLSRFKTTFLSKNKGPMSKTWARKSYLDELESMAPTSPTSPRSYPYPHSVSVSAPVSPHDLEGGIGMRRIT